MGELARKTLGNLPPLNGSLRVGHPSPVRLHHEAYLVQSQGVSLCRCLTLSCRFSASNGGHLQGIVGLARGKVKCLGVSVGAVPVWLAGLADDPVFRTAASTRFGVFGPTYSVPPPAYTPHRELVIEMRGCRKLGTGEHLPRKINNRQPGEPGQIERVRLPNSIKSGPKISRPDPDSEKGRPQPALRRNAPDSVTQNKAKQKRQTTGRL
ncbi:uncharacterized protein B0T15DRAFT_116099 [Chaetomium strumarium]|uniref:Uncharacterized protein n=1 Tax=Chaetomium strumarium TaxID=1170767 RepID=A0AAJ0M4G8_9PEZI|nr:hypothetical protein B0T15DRAFT_116099 [Chaetomium strumarium]